MKIINTRDRYGVLPKMMYDSDRVDQLRALTAFYKGSANQVVETKVVLNVADSFVPLPDLTGIAGYLTCDHKVQMEENIRRCFLFFFKNTTYTEEGAHYRVKYSGIEYTIRTNIVNSFFYWQTYNDITTVVDIEKDDREGNVRSPKLIPSRGSATDGQLKILTDAVLAVDAVEIRENLKILIVGSSHDPMSQPRSSYEPIFYMVSNSTIDMYDFVEESGESRVNSNLVRRFRKPYDYANLVDYDVYLDDSWYQGKTPYESRLYNSNHRELPEHYSIKTFEDITMFNIYSQVGYTKAGEKRLVSRSIIPSYTEDIRLGGCSFCLELKFFLQHTYDDEFYKSVLRQHKHSSCCPPSWYKELNGYQKLKERFDPNWVQVLDTDFNVTDVKFVIRTEKYPLRSLVNSRLVMLSPVEQRREHLEQVAVVVEDERQCTQVLKFARAIYYYDGKRLYHHVQSSSIPTAEVVEHVKNQTQVVKSTIQNELSKKSAARIHQYVRQAKDPVPVYDDPVASIAPQEKSIQRVKKKKLEYRAKYDADVV